ncbi:hypothetical protein RQP46_003467 [Phenoliferia psychrophenolica]
MECGAHYIFETPEQFWAELLEIISLSPSSTLDELDYALRNYVAFASTYMDQFLTAPGQLDHALFALLESPLFTSHDDRMIANLIACITPGAPRSTLFITLMLLLHLGLTNPLGSSSEITHALPGGLNASAKVFKALRRQWTAVVPVLMHCVENAGVVYAAGQGQPDQDVVNVRAMPSDGWEERVGTAATVVLYEVCRVQRLSPEELSIFSFEFISHLFTLVERTRDAEDETFNYSLIKFIIALNEQFMVSSLPAPTPGQGALPPPILPTIVGKRKPERDPNLVLEVLKGREGDSKTFGENIIFILNRSNGSPDSLCVSLLILKILYLLFTTSGTHEYFYTNDLCVLVDVFIRELNDLGEESEGLKHTYLRVLHPLLTNTQLRHHPYKRPHLRRVLLSLISNSNYKSIDPTTRRLVERNLRGTWCEGLTDDSVGEGERRAVSRKGSDGSGKDVKPVMGLGWSSGMGGSRGGEEPGLRASSAPGMRTGLGLHGGSERTGSTLSIDAVAQAEDHAPAHGPHHHRKKGSLDRPAIAVVDASSPRPSPVYGQRRAAPEPPTLKSRAALADTTRSLEALALKPCH